MDPPCYDGQNVSVLAVNHDFDSESSTFPSQRVRSEDSGSYVKINKPTDPPLNQNMRQLSHLETDRWNYIALCCQEALATVPTCLARDTVADCLFSLLLLRLVLSNFQNGGINSGQFFFKNSSYQ